MRASVEEQKGLLWKSFFIFSGIMSLVYWSFLLNLTLYFDLTIAQGYFLYVTLTYSIGSIASFVTGKLIFKKWKSQKIIFAGTLIASLSYIFLIILLESISCVLARKILVITLMGVYSYFNGYFQGVMSGFASICGPLSISAYNTGTGIAGFGANLVAIVFVFIFPTTRPQTRLLRLHHQIRAYLGFILVMFSCYLLVMVKYFKRFGHFVSSFDEVSDNLKSISPPLEECSSLTS